MNDDRSFVQIYIKYMNVKNLFLFFFSLCQKINNKKLYIIHVYVLDEEFVKIK